MTAKSVCALLITLLFLTGCTTTGLVNGTIFTDVHGPIAADHSGAKGTIVEGRSTVTGILGFATGDCSIETAIANALAKAPGSTKLENMTRLPCQKYLRHLCRIYNYSIRCGSKINFFIM